MKKPKKEYQIVRISKSAYNKILEKAKKNKRSFINQMDIEVKA